VASVRDLFRRAPVGHEAAEWGRRYSDDLGHAWHECPRGDWALWLAGILEITAQDMTRASLDCARFALSLLPEAEDEARLQAVLSLADRWVEGEGDAETLRTAAEEILAIYHDPRREGGDDHPLAGYATSAVAAAVLVPSYHSTYGLACAASAVGLASAQVAAPNDETALLDAHAYCARLVRRRIPFEKLVTTRGFRLYSSFVT
jgi:hypothetical protein